jgi:hypothetical protein
VRVTPSLVMMEEVVETMTRPNDHEPGCDYRQYERVGISHSLYGQLCRYNNGGRYCSRSIDGEKLGFQRQGNVLKTDVSDSRTSGSVGGAEVLTLPVTNGSTIF